MGVVVRAKILRVSPVLLLLCACEEQPGPAVQSWPAEVLNSAHWRVQAVPVSAQCGVCHRKEFADWAGSDHAWALRELNTVHDTEPFHRQRLRAHGSELTFAANRKGELLLTDSQSKRNFKVDYVLGRRPLVQYLVKGEDGGWHTPSAAWDVLRHEWFDMFEDDSRLSAEGLATRNSGDWGHWLGRGMNWNSQCAWCHTSHFRKNYNEAADTYASTWKEPGVTCIQCHKQGCHQCDERPEGDVLHQSYSREVHSRVAQVFKQVIYHFFLPLSVFCLLLHHEGLLYYLFVVEVVFHSSYYLVIFVPFSGYKDD
jgi:hypothetical protein